MRKWIYSDDMQAEKMWFEAVINNSLYLTSPRIRGRKKYFSDFSNVNYDAAKMLFKIMQNTYTDTTGTIAVF